MGRPRTRFQASPKTQQVVRDFGAVGVEIRVPMRRCDDVPRYIRKIQRACRETADSTLRFGPPARGSR